MRGHVATGEASALSSSIHWQVQLAPHTVERTVTGLRKFEAKTELRNVDLTFKIVDTSLKRRHHHSKWGSNLWGKSRGGVPNQKRAIPLVDTVNMK
jgi:hypothetical protein